MNAITTLANIFVIALLNIIVLLVVNSAGTVLPNVGD